MQYRELTYDQVESTNDVVKRALEAGEPEGLAVRAWRQTAGYGRQGRVWESPEGGLYLSVLLRPDVAPAWLPTLSLVAGLAARDALAGVVPDADSAAIQLKWPNDVVCSVCASATDESSGESIFPVSLGLKQVLGCGCSAEGVSTKRVPHEPKRPVDVSCESGLSERLEISSAEPASPVFKLAGISLEAYRGGLCLGVGVNVVRPRAAVEVSGKNVPVYLSDLGAFCKAHSEGAPSAADAAFVRQAVDVVAAALLREFADAYERWQREGFAPFRSAYEQRLSLMGQHVSVADANGDITAEGEVAGVDERGCLLLRTPQGLRSIASGEAHLR